MTIDDADEKGTLMAADSGSSRVFICVTLDPRPLMYHIGLTRYGGRAHRHGPQR
jgi:hypothetical protein